MRILIAASGSGGHLFPALHIARALVTIDSTVEVEFVGAGRPLEMQLVEPLYPLHIVAARRVAQQGALGLVKMIFTIPRAVSQLRTLFSQRGPVAVVGVGGYASVMPVLYAVWNGVPTLIHEAEQRPGLANRVLAPFVSVVSVARDTCVIWGAKSRISAGQPMRAGLAAITPARTTPQTVLVLGGSQGAAALDCAASMLARLAAAHGLTVIHQTRSDACEKVAKVYRDAGVSAKVQPFFSDMVDTYARSDLIISRAGASTVSELEVIGRPVIFVPYPHAQADHQSENALQLAQSGRAAICKEGDGFEERLAAQIKSILLPSLSSAADQRPESSQLSYQSMRRDPQSTRHERAALVIAQQILDLVKT